MRESTYAHFNQLKASVSAFDHAYWNLNRLEEAYSYEESEMIDAKDMLDFRKHQLVSRMKFLITQIEGED